MKQQYSDTGQWRTQDYDPESGNINKEHLKIALASCPEALFRPGSRKGNPNKPRGSAELRTQRPKVREARAPVICGEKYWRVRNFRGRGHQKRKLGRREREVFPPLAEH